MIILRTYSTLVSNKSSREVRTFVCAGTIEKLDIFCPCRIGNFEIIGPLSPLTIGDFEVVVASSSTATVF